MKVSSSKLSAALEKCFLLSAILILSASAAFAQTQANAADLSGSVVDPSEAVVPGATVTAKNLATGITRTATTGDSGTYQFIALPPGDYEITTEAATFKKTVISPVKLTVGQSAELKIQLEIGSDDVVVNVSGGDVELVETTKTSVSNTINEERIDNLPINERSATGFALTISTVGRDNGRPVGPAPTSGLNIGGQRGRSTLVQVDGADFTDNSVNAARSTVSQEAVQEYQVTTNSYLPEFGRATGGIVNVVTKSGGNQFSGNVFGFIRHKSIQARNAFAPVIDGDPNKKPPYTRVQYGFTLGGPVIKERSFFFFSFEQRRRQESGFFTGDIIGGATSSITIGAPFLPVSQTFSNLTPAQAAYIQANLATNPSSALAYAYFTSVGSQTALNGSSTLVNFLPGLGIPQGSLIGQRFLLSGAPVPLTTNADGQFVAFRPLSRLARVFPISDGTTYNSLRYDHLITEGQQMTVRVGYNPSRITGIQDESQNQTLGQNDYSRTGIQDLEDVSFSASLASVLPNNMLNEAFFSFGKRDATFDSQVPSVAHQITGTGFLGSNPFSPVNRTETRFQLRDNLTVPVGSHIFKFGGDFNWINVNAKFELNFPGLFNFGQQSASTFVPNVLYTPPPTTTNPNPVPISLPCDSAIIPLASRCPALTPIQTYGLGFPSAFIQGFGDPNSKIRNRPIAFFAQDTWKIFNNFTFNYGVRYDVELTDQAAPTGFTDPLTGIALSETDVQSLQNQFNITQGFPRDKNNIAPRVGFAWDLAGDSKTVVRGAIGMFYDHPLLAIAFNSDVADGSQQQQSTLLPFGGPAPNQILNAFQVFHGTAIPGVTPGLASSAQYLRGFQRFNPATFTGFGPVLPFTLHVSKDFEYPYAIQGNLAIERQLDKDTAVSASYITVNSRHLPHPQDVNSPRLDLLVENFRRYAGRNPANFTEAAFFFPRACSATTPCPPGFTLLVPGLVGRNAAGQTIVSPIAANYFRPTGPNYYFVTALSNGALNKAAFDSLLAGSVRTPGPIAPYGDISAQLSDGNSSYNAMNLEMRKRFSTNIQFLASYTWSHSIDDSSDLQTLLKPQDNYNFKAEKATSLFDQRHRFVFSGVMSSPDTWRSGSGFKRFLADFTVSPIIEFSSGRPFNILAVGDANGDLQGSNERPSVLSDGTLCQNLVDCPAGFSSFPVSGNLGRNLGITHNYFSVDARLTKKIRFGERVSLDLIAEGFNLFNRFNEASANPFYNVVNAFGQRKGGKYYSQPTAAYDPRQFQFGFKFNF